MSYQSSPRAREPFFERVNNSKLQQYNVRSDGECLTPADIRSLGDAEGPFFVPSLPNAPSISTFFRKWYSFTSPHLFPNDFQNGLRDVCLFAILTMGKGGKKGSYTSTVEDRLRVRRSQRFAAKITL
eukprot:scaffold10288_cov137-Skeletonema_marinoi.AAC.4